MSKKYSKYKPSPRSLRGCFCWLFGHKFDKMNLTFYKEVVISCTECPTAHVWEGQILSKRLDDYGWKRKKSG